MVLLCSLEGNICSIAAPLAENLESEECRYQFDE